MLIRPGAIGVKLGPAKKAAFIVVEQVCKPAWPSQLVMPTKLRKNGKQLRFYSL
jgi:hypothetical protein